VLDRKWREHLYEMDYLKEGIGLRAMAQRDPLVEYQREGYRMFQAMDEGIKEQVVGFLFNLQVSTDAEAEAAPAALAHDADGSAPAATVTAVPAQAGAENVTAAPAARDGGSGDKAPVSGRGAKAGVRTAPKSAGTGPRLVAKGLEAPAQPAGALQYSAPDQDGGEAPVVRRERAGGGTAPDGAVQAEAYPGTGLNQPCPCGSGKKYKMCHGRRK
jgi:preprotein translocase subunit SecA